MKHLNFTRFIIILLVFIAYQSGVTIAQEESHRIRKANLTYEAVIKNIPENAGKVYVWLPLPSSNAHQEITDLSIISAFPYKKIKESKYGNRILFIDASDNKGKKVSIEVTFNVKRKEHRGRTAVSGKLEDKLAGQGLWQFEKFLLPGRLSIIDDSIKSLAVTITENEKESIQKVRAIYDYLIQKIEYNKEAPGWGRGDTKRAITVCKGNCSDFHSAFTSLTRAAGIPSRFQYGFTLPNDPQGTAIAHCWAEFYADGYGWIPVDISEADKHPELKEYYFGNHDANRILFSTGRDIKLEPKQDGEPLNFFINPYVEIDGKRYDNVELLTKYINIVG